MNDALQALENQYFTLRESLSTMIGQGASEAQLSQLRGCIAASRNNYYTAINRFFHLDDPQVGVLVTQMNTEQLTLQASIDHLGDVAKVLDVITKAVTVGTQLAAKAVSF